MKKKNGFIAISLIYSFFLVFLMVLLGIATEYTKNRILLGDVKKETQKYLDCLGEFNAILIPSRSYDAAGNCSDIKYVAGEEIIYDYEPWIVILDDDNYVKMILKRNLNETEINSALKNSQDKEKGDYNVKNEIPNGIYDVNSNVQMCFSEYYDPTVDLSSIPKKDGKYSFYCNYKDVNHSNLYTYNNSIAKYILNYWYDNNTTLQKAELSGSLYQFKDFTDGLKTIENYGMPNQQEVDNKYTSYVKLPSVSEDYPIIKSFIDTDIWYLEGIWEKDASGNRTGKSLIKIGSNINDKISATEKRGIRPIIAVKKNKCP